MRFFNLSLIEFLAKSGHNMDNKKVAQLRFFLNKNISLVKNINYCNIYLSGRRAPYHLLKRCAWINWPSFSL